MNRGQNYSPIFIKKHHYEMFIKLLQETQKRFGAEIHVYCLLDNHYHLLLQTPRGNLSRVMRHIDGVYTQRFNREQKRDGSLFRGRYKAILIEADNYLLQVSRYIHLNPVKAKLTKDAAVYKWSSYSDYVDEDKTNEWLSTNTVLDQLQSSRAQEKYRSYVEQGIDDEIEKFYGTKYQSSILGSKGFKEAKLEGLNNKTTIDSRADIKRTKEIPSIEAIIKAVADYYQLSVKDLKQGKRGTENLPRSFSIYICSHKYGYKIKDIGAAYGISAPAVSVATGKIGKRLQQNTTLQKEYAELERCI